MHDSWREAPRPHRYYERFDQRDDFRAGARARPGRKVLLLISESRDRGSRATFDEAMEEVGRQGIEVFGAHYSAYATTWIARPEDLQEAQGGNLMAIFTELGRGMHRLEVAVEGRGDLRVRGRKVWWG